MSTIVELLDQIQCIKEAVAELYATKTELEQQVKQAMMEHDITDVTNGTLRAKVTKPLTIVNEKALAEVVEHEVITSYKFSGVLLRKLYDAGEHRELINITPTIEFSKDERRKH